MKSCKQCGAMVPDDAPEGLCARCLLSVAMKAGTFAAVDPMETKQAAARVGSAPAAAPIDIGDAAEVARRLPQFEILELLGRGGMGVVYKARQLQLDRMVALKILPPADATSPDFVERFRREARSLARLSHPNVVSVHDFGETGGLYYLVMEFVDGLNLRQMMHAGRITPAQALAVVPPICDALQFAHEEGVVHRDIKPENILIDRKGRVKIADFGLAKLLGRAETDPRLTVSGATLGTPRYMAPEQVEKPENVDHRADIYSLGVVFYEMLTGELPMGRFAPPSHKVQIDVRLDEIVLHALERDVERRYQHASEIKTEVEIVSNTPSPPPSPQTKAGKPWPAWVWCALLVLVTLPFLYVAELNRGEEMAGHGPKFFFANGIELALLALGAFAVIKLVELRPAKVGQLPDAPFSQPWLGIIAVLFSACLIAIGPFPHVEWLGQTLQVTPQTVVNAMGMTVELAGFSQTFVRHGSDFGQGIGIAVTSVLAGAFILLAPRRRRWNVARSVLLVVSGLAILVSVGDFEIHRPRDSVGTTDSVEVNAKTDPTYSHFRDDFRRQEATDAAAKNVPAEMLGQGVLEALERPTSKEAFDHLLKRLQSSRRGFTCEYRVAGGQTVCAYAALALTVLGVIMLRQTMRSSPAAFAGFFHAAEAWGGMLLLTPCLLVALFVAWVENMAWIPPGAANPVIVNVPDHRVHPIGAEFWQGRVIAAVCIVAILVVIAVAFKRCKPVARAASLGVAGVVSIACAISFSRGQLRPTDVSWHDFQAVAQHGATAADSRELRRILAERPRYVEQLAALDKEVQARAATLAPDSAEARKLAQGPEVNIYQNQEPGPQFSMLFGLGLLLLGIRDGYRCWRRRRERLTPDHDWRPLGLTASQRSQ